MNKIKVIDLLNMISKGEEVPKVIKFLNYKYIFDTFDKEYQRYQNGVCYGFGEDRRLDIILDDEVEIIEEEKEIPEKLPYYSLEKIQKAKNKDEWREERITLLEKRVEDLHIKMNDLLDYLKSKGDE